MDDASFNGAQIKEAKQMVIDVATGVLPRRSGVAMLQVLLGMTKAEAEAIMVPENFETAADPSASGTDVPAAEPAQGANSDEVDKRNRARGPGTKHGAREALLAAVRSGAVSKPAKCSKCGGGGQIEGHHANYDKPNAVTWLCSQCHHDLHARLRGNSDGTPTYPGIKTYLSIPLSPAARVMWQEAVDAAEGVLGGLEPPGGNAPHVTVLFMGAVDPEELPDVTAGLAEVAGDTTAFTYASSGVCPFDPGPQSGGKTPIVMRLESWDIEPLHSALLRRLSKPNRAEQYKRFEAHVTLGILARAPTPDERSQLMELDVRIEGAATAVELAFGKITVGSYPLAPTRTDEAV